MITVVQRVSEAKVTVGGEVVGEIGPGLLALAAVVRGDTERDVEWMAAKLAVLRVFRSDGKHFDKDVKEIGGSILLVSNFTVAASTRQGRRPSLDRAAEPAVAEAVFVRLVEATRAQRRPPDAPEPGGNARPCRRGIRALSTEVGSVTAGGLSRHAAASSR